MHKSFIFIGSVLLCALWIVAANFNANAIDYTTLPEYDSNFVDQNRANFNKIMEVLTSPRCMNCHPSDRIPKQGDDSHPHYFDVSQGRDGRGFEAIKCSSCHQSENNEFSGVPGAPQWRLAPQEMGWEGLSKKQIAELILDPEKNGGRTPEQTMHHLTEHELVLWAWAPGLNLDGKQRTPAPVPLEDYKKAVREWIEKGAIIPEN